MAVKEILVPVGAVGCVCELGVEAHYRREKLGEGENHKAGYEGVVYGCRRGGFALEKIIIKIQGPGGVGLFSPTFLPLIGHLPLQR